MRIYIIYVTIHRGGGAGMKAVLILSNCGIRAIIYCQTGNSISSNILYLTLAAHCTLKCRTLNSVFQHNTLLTALTIRQDEYLVDLDIFS